MQRLIESFGHRDKPEPTREVVRKEVTSLFTSPQIAVLPDGITYIAPHDLPGFPGLENVADVAQRILFKRLEKSNPNILINAPTPVVRVLLSQERKTSTELVREPKQPKKPTAQEMVIAHIEEQNKNKQGKEHSRAIKHQTRFAEARLKGWGRRENKVAPMSWEQQLLEIEGYRIANNIAGYFRSIRIVNDPVGDNLGAKMKELSRFTHDEIMEKPGYAQLMNETVKRINTRLTSRQEQHVQALRDYEQVIRELTNVPSASSVLQVEISNITTAHKGRISTNRAEDVSAGFVQFWQIAGPVEIGESDFISPDGIPTE